MRNMNIKSIQQWLSRAGELVNEFYNAPYRSAIARAKGGGTAFPIWRAI